MVLATTALLHDLMAAIHPGGAEPGAAQALLGDLAEGLIGGVDHGSTSSLPEGDATTRFLTFDNNCSADFGPDIWSANLACPETRGPRDPFEMVAVPAGLGRGGPRGVLALGLGDLGPMAGAGLSWVSRPRRGDCKRRPPHLATA